MQTAETIALLSTAGARPPGSDAERRAAVRLRDHIAAGGRGARLETAWVYPGWAPAQIAHAVLALAGGVVGVNEHTAGLVILAVALVSLYGDLSGRWHLLRGLTPRRATQNVVSEPAAGGPGDTVRLVITAPLDTARDGAFAGWIPSLLTMQIAATAALVAVIGARLAGASGDPVGIVQLVVMIVILAVLAVLVDLISSDRGLAAHPPPLIKGPPTGAVTAANAAIAAALALTAELDRAPLRRLEVELALAGAATGPALGFDAHVRELKRTRTATDTVVLSIEPLSSPHPTWRRRDGLIAPVAYHPTLLALAQRTAQSEPRLGASSTAAPGYAQALAARRRRWPALAISGSAGDIPATVEFAYALVIALDAQLSELDRSRAKRSSQTL